MLLGFGACIVILLVTVVSVAVYSAPKIVLTDQGIEVQNWASLFASTNSTCDWSEIEVITVKKPGPLAGMFGYGTILVQTAGVQTDLTLTYVPRVDYWAEFIDSRS